MEDKWYVRWLHFLRQVFCWHSLKCSEGPHMPSMHFVCMKCDWSYTDWEAEAAYYHNLSAQWWQKYTILKEKYEPESPEQGKD